MELILNDNRKIGSHENHGIISLPPSNYQHGKRPTESIVQLSLVSKNWRSYGYLVLYRRSRKCFLSPWRVFSLQLFEEDLLLLLILLLLSLVLFSFNCCRDKSRKLTFLASLISSRHERRGVWSHIASTLRDEGGGGGGGIEVGTPEAVSLWTMQIFDLIYAC